MACTVERILDVARGEIGVTESPPGGNSVKYNTAYYGNPVNDPLYAWCTVFIWWLFKQAGAPEQFYGGRRTASVPTLWDWYRRTGRFVESDYRPGDILFFNLDRPLQHIAIVESVNPDGTVTTIDGNTAMTAEHNGGAVLRRTRELKYAAGAGRPTYLVQKEKK